MHRLIRGLAHLPVAAKLWLGFGLVLLSTLGVATIAKLLSACLSADLFD